MKKKLNCILLIDDNDADNRYHQILIEKLKLDVTIKVAENGMDAINYLKNEHQTIPELIFLDINMPRMNGWEFLEAYKYLKNEQKSKILIIMLTTSVNPDDARKSEKIPDVSGYIFKPLTKDLLSGILNQHFDYNLKEKAGIT